MLTELQLDCNKEFHVIHTKITRDEFHWPKLIQCNKYLGLEVHILNQLYFNAYSTINLYKSINCNNVNDNPLQQVIFLNTFFKDIKYRTSKRLLRTTS